MVSVSARLAALIEHATVDAYNECGQTTGFFTMTEENLAVPFVTQVLGMVVTVESGPATSRSAPDPRVIAAQEG